ncbi:hypothetical protein HYQ46_006406 [Verticillium longisporum]|nr:hypothetical protein HYQ46_006406 [Verticillium longisporum]
MFGADLSLSACDFEVLTVSDGDARSKTGITTSTGAASPRWRWRKAKRGELCEEPTFSFGRMGPQGIKLKRSAPPLSRPELRDHDTSCQVVASLQNSFAAAAEGQTWHVDHGTGDKGHGSAMLVLVLAV